MKKLSFPIAIIFLVNSIAWGEPSLSGESAIPRHTYTSGIHIPEQYGKIEKDSVQDFTKQVILVKDAHCHYEAQRNIAKILDALISEYKIDLVGIEGAYGKVDPSVIADCPDKKKRKEVADKYLKEGWLSASEALALEKGSEYGFTIWGVEDLKLYLNDLKVFRNVYKGSDIAGRFIEIAKGLTSSLKNRLYPQDVLDFDKRISSYANGDLKLTDLLEYLYKIKKDRFLDYINLRLIIKAILLEKDIDFSKVEYERSSLIKYLEKNSPKEEIQEIVKNSLLYKLGKLSSPDYYAYLKSLIPKDNYKKYLNLHKYTNTIKLHSRIDENSLFSEMDLLIEETYKDYISDNLVWELYNANKEIGFLNKLLRLEITREELITYTQKGINLTKIADFLKIQCRVHNIPIPPEFIDADFLAQAKDFYKQPNEFYKYALDRDRAITENLLTKMEKEDKDRAVLVVGGFHASGVEKLLNERNIDVIVITPSITKEDVETKRIYLSRIMDERVQPDKLLGEIGINNLAEPRIAAVESPWWEAFAGIISGISNDLLRDTLRMSPSLEAAAEELCGTDGLTQSDISAILGFIQSIPPDTPGREILVGMIKEKDSARYRIFLEEIINNCEEDINGTIIRLREIEDAKGDVSGLYEEVNKKINRLQELYREYEDFIRDKRQKDERNDFLIMVPSCNRPNDLARLLESLYRELILFGYATNRRIHVVVIDDSTVDGSASTYEEIIRDFENNISCYRNVSVKLYSREEQRQIIKNLKDKDIDLSFFINKSPEDKNFGGKGYAGVRNISRIIGAIETERVFGDDDNLLVLHMDDDMAFGNPLRKTIEKITNDEDRDNLDRTHIFNYFAAVDGVFRENPELRYLSGGCSVNDGTMATPEGKDCIYYGDKKVRTDFKYPRRGFMLGGNYITTKEFELESIPFIPGEHRCEDSIMGGITKGRRLNGIALAHYQSLQRDIPKGIIDEFVGRAIIDFFESQLNFPILPQIEGEEGTVVSDQTSGVDNLYQIINRASRLSLPEDASRFSYGNIVRNVIKELGRKFSIPPYKDRDRFTKEIISFSAELGFQRKPKGFFEGVRERAPPEINEYFIRWESEIAGVDKKYAGEWNERLSKMKNIRDIEKFLNKLSGDNIEQVMLILRLFFKETFNNNAPTPEKKAQIIKGILDRLIIQKELYFKKKVMEAQERFRETLLETGRNLGVWQKWNEWRNQNRDSLVKLDREETPPLAIITGRSDKERELTQKTSWRVAFGPFIEEVIFRGYPFLIGQVLSFFLSPIVGIIGNILWNLTSSSIFVLLHKKKDYKTAIFVTSINMLLGIILFPLGINYFELISISTAIHSLINTYILIRQQKQKGLSLNTIVRQLTQQDRSPAFAVITEKEALQNIILTHKGVSVDVNISPQLLDKRDIIKGAFGKILEKHPDAHDKLKGINITLEEKVDYLIGIGKEDIKINSLLLDMGDELLMNIVSYGMESIFTGESDKSVLLQIIETIIDKYEKDIDNAIIEIREKEDRKEGVEDLYEKVLDKMRNIQKFYRVYEEFIKNEKIEDPRDDFMIVVPTCDRPHDLKRLLDSLYRELELFRYATNRKIHIVIVDDSGISDFEGTYITIINSFKKKLQRLGNVTIKFYDRDEQRNIIENLREQGIDLGFFVNEAEARKKSFGHKGYAGIRNMLKIISAIEQEEHFSVGKPLLVLHVDDDMRFSNPLRKPKKIDRLLVEELDEQHIFNYFNRVTRIFAHFYRTQRRQLPILSGDVTGRGGHISSAFERKYWCYQPIRGEMEQNGQLYGSHYISDAGFDIDSIPLIPAGIRGEDEFLEELTGSRIQRGLSLSHHQSSVRDIDKDLLNSFEGIIFFILLYKVAPFLREHRDDSGWTNWEFIKDEIPELETKDIDKKLSIHLREYWHFVLSEMKILRENFNIGKHKSPFVNELVSYYYEKELRDSMKEKGLKKYLSSWPEEIFEIKLDEDMLKTLKEGGEISLDEFLEGENDLQRRIYILRTLLKNIYEDKSMDEEIKERVIINALEKILEEKDLFLKEWIIKRQKEFLEKMEEMSKYLEAWERWNDWRKGEGVSLKALREKPKEVSPENIGKDVEFVIVGDKIRINATELGLKDAKGVDVERTCNLASGLYASELTGFIDFLRDILSQQGKIMVFNGTNESCAIGAFAHMKDGVLYIDNILLDNEIGGMTIIHEALHAFLFSKTLSGLTGEIDKIPDEKIRDMIYTKADPYKSEPNKYLAYLRHYYARYYLQNSQTGVYSGSINERFTYHIRLNAVSNMLGIKPAELNRLLAGADTKTTLEYRNKLLNVLKKDGSITNDELQIIMDSADKVNSIIGLIKGIIPKRLQERIDDIRMVLTIHITIKRLEEPQLIQELIEGLKALAEENGIDPDTVKGIVMELYKLDGYFIVGDNLVINPYYSLMLEGIRNMFGIEEDSGLFDKLDRYQRIKALAMDRLNVSATRDVKDRKEIAAIVLDYLKGKDQTKDALEKLARIIALYKIAEEMPVEKSRIETILKRIDLREVPETTSKGTIDSAKITIADISKSLSAVQGLYYLDRFNGGLPVFNAERVIDRLESGGKLDIKGLKEFMDYIGREYMLLEKGKEAKLLTALYGYSLLEKLLDSNIPVKETEWPSDIPLVVEAKLLIGDIVENPDGTFTIQPLGGPCIGQIRKAAQKGQLKILYGGREKDAVRMWLLEHGIRINEDAFITEYPRDLIKKSTFGISILTQDTTRALKGLSDKHRIISGRVGESDLLLMSRMAIILGSHNDLAKDKETIREKFNILYKAYYQGTIDEGEIARYVSSVVDAIQSGVPFIIELPKIVPFVKPFYDTLKQTREVVGSAA